MKKIMILIFSFAYTYAAQVAGKVPLAMQDESASRGDNPLVSSQIITNITQYNQGFGEKFLHFQTEWFKPLFGYMAIGVIAVFLLHYLIIGPKKFSHEGRQFYIFSLFIRVVHWIAAIGFILIIPTGFMIVFGDALGGGTPIRYARYLHTIGTVFFAVSIIPMFLGWFIPMIITFDDIKWLLIGGGYLSKKKREVPAGKFNAGQKMWFWIAVLGGFVMIATGALMYFQYIDLKIIKDLNMDNIELLRLSAIVHNFLGVAVAALFITHVYMAVFAIKGALDSMISGNKSEDELKHLHSSYYKKLIKKESDTKS